MDHRTVPIAAALLCGLSSLAGLAGHVRSATVVTETGIAVKDAGAAAPTRGMTMTQVASRFGTPVTKEPAVGTPPISRWEYPGFVVYFERERVIHAVVANS